ncbi:MAG: N-acetylglucosamine-6-phosphate deacetylase [Lentisphaeria bacterium]|nr:N-acetylglucosamine-6-phosphate deacetylase [Lentisphaeria bacterium]
MAKNRDRRLYVVDYLITPDQRIDNGAVLCEGARILAVGGLSGFSIEDELRVERFENAYMTPGFVDTHIHGAGGFDCSRAADSPRSMPDMSAVLGQRGVTGFFPTVVADEPEVMLQNLSTLAAAMRGDMPGAEALAIHIEGPFLNPAKCGAQMVEHLQPVDINFAAELIAAGDGLVKSMTFAPELRGAERLIELLLRSGVTPSMGHSLADEKKTLRAIDAGANHCTHLFNGMEPLHQRDMGLASIVLTDNRVTAELIIDGRHVHPRMVDLACRCKRADRIVGISDGTMAFGMPNGTYHIGPSDIVVHGGYSQANGKLAGTTTMLDSGWHSLMSCGHLSENRAAQAVTRTPAECFGFTDRGVLLPGKRADLAVFERGTNRLLMTVRRGEIIYKAEEENEH